MIRIPWTLCCDVKVLRWWHRIRNRKRPATQEGRRLRRYKRRFQVERFFSWIDDFRRLVVRWEYHATNYLGFLHLACIRMLIKYL